MKPYKIAMLLFALAITFNACSSDDTKEEISSPNDGSQSSPVLLRENTPYSTKIGAVFSGEGKSFYRFTPSVSGTYLFVTGDFSTPQDLNWFVYDDSSYAVNAWISDGLGNNFWDTTPEYTKLPLTAGTDYYAFIQNWDEEDITFTITVVRDETPASEGNTTSPVLLTEGTTHDGKIGKFFFSDTKHQSYYTFTPAESKTYTITTNGYYVYNNVAVPQDLDITLYGNAAFTSEQSSVSTSSSNSETLTTPLLTAGTPYYLLIKNASTSKAEIHFSLLIE